MITEKTVRHVARIARLKLTEKEIKTFSKELDEVLKAFSKIDEVDTSGVEPSFHVYEIINVFREDKVEPSLEQNNALKNTKHKEKGFFKGPRVV